MYHPAGISCSILVSLVCLYLSQAAFTPAINVSLAMFIAAALYVKRRYFKTAIALVIINGLAVAGVIAMMRGTTMIVV